MAAAANAAKAATKEAIKRVQLPSIGDQAKAFWLHEAGVFPIIGIVSGAGVLCSYHMFRYMTRHPDIKLNTATREEMGPTNGPRWWEHFVRRGVRDTGVSLFPTMNKMMYTPPKYN